MENKSSEVRAPSIDDLKLVAAKHKLEISEEDLKVFSEHILKSFDAVYKEIDKYPDQYLPVKYGGSAGRLPTPEENPYNAWVRITDRVGSGVGKLAGRSVAIKDNVSLAGVPMSIGSEFMQGYTPQYSATIVDRILDEGAMVRGVAACEDMCFSGHSFSSVTGPVLNPRDTSHSAGGSSSGSAVLVSSGAVDMAVGTDQGGSIRIPSCWCGVVGLKPTFGLVPYTGISSLSSAMDFVGPIARTVKDCALLLEVIAGNDDLDYRQPPNIKRKDYVAQLNEGIKGLRVGILKEGFEGAEADVADLVKKAGNNLSKLGATVTEFSTDLHRKARLFSIPILTEGSYTSLCNYGIDQVKGHKDVLLQDFLHTAMNNRTNSLPVSVQKLLLNDGYVKERYGSHFYAKASNAMRGIVAEYDELFKQCDVIVMPTITYKPPKQTVGKMSLKEFLQEHIRNTTNTLPYNATGHPALSVNVGYSEGLPVGMMIVGRHWEDDVVLRTGYAVEQQTDAVAN